MASLDVGVNQFFKEFYFINQRWFQVRDNIDGFEEIKLMDLRTKITPLLQEIDDIFYAVFQRQNKKAGVK